MDDTNPRAVVGANNPPIWATLRGFAAEENFSQTVTDYLNEEYKPFDEPFEKLLAEAREIAAPKVLPDKATRDKVPGLMKRIRDLAGKFDSFHTREKEPYLRGGQAVDQKFYGKIDKLQRRQRTNNPGAYDVLQRMLTDFDNAVLAAEQARRQALADEEARKARAALAEAQAAQAAADEALRAAERARKPETVEAKTVVARTAAEEAIGAKADASVAFGRAEDAHIGTLAKPADIMRARLDDGTMSTMGQETYAELVNRDLVDKNALWAYIGVKEIEKALRAWAKATDYRTEMAGAKVGRKNKSKVL